MVTEEREPRSGFRAPLRMEVSCKVWERTGGSVPTWSSPGGKECRPSTKSVDRKRGLMVILDRN